VPLSLLPPLPTGTPGDTGAAAGIEGPVSPLLPWPPAASAGSTGAAVGGSDAASLLLLETPLPPPLVLPWGAPLGVGAAAGACGVRPAGGRENFGQEGAVDMKVRYVRCVPSSCQLTCCSAQHGCRIGSTLWRGASPTDTCPASTLPAG
jgi:hypothetical protein